MIVLSGLLRMKKEYLSRIFTKNYLTEFGSVFTNCALFGIIKEFCRNENFDGIVK